MKELEATKFYQDALNYVSKEHADELERVKSVSPETFEKMDIQTFLWDYCWVVYASGFRVSTVEAKMEALEEAFQGFDIEKLSKMETVAAILSVINHRGKAEGFLKGAKLIYGEGFKNFKKRLMEKPEGVLRELPYIGPTTWRHLARNVGLKDLSKDDLHLTRLMQKFDAPSVDALTSYLAKNFNEREGVVDLVLWRYCADHKAVSLV
jgi:hypothetical protein